MSACGTHLQRKWIEEQDSLKQRLVLEDDFTWTIEGEKLRYVGGVDLSFSKDDPCIACGALVVVDLESLTVVHDDFSLVRLEIPYIPGFLAFREAPVLLNLLEKMKQDVHPFYPQAMRSTEGSLKPIFISTGHRILLNTAVKYVKMCCKYRVPEPIRQADIRSRAFLQKHSGSGNIRTIKIL